MTTIEKVARAIRAAQTGWDMPANEWTYADLEAHGLIDEARAAIEALREPSEAMFSAAIQKISAPLFDEYADERAERDGFDAGWNAAIDAALNEGKE